MTLIPHVLFNPEVFKQAMVDSKDNTFLSLIRVCLQHVRAMKYHDMDDDEEEESDTTLLSNTNMKPIFQYSPSIQYKENPRI